jgi:hypothetical protein
LRTEFVKDESQLLMLHRIEQLVEKLENIADIEARTAVVEVLQSLLIFHRTALERCVEELERNGLRRRLVEMAATEPLVNGLLLLHGLHPVGIETRSRNAVQAIEPYLKSGGYVLEEIRCEKRNLHLQFRRSAAAVGSSVALATLVEDAVFSAAPDVDEIVIEGFDEQDGPRRARFVSVAELLRGAAAS